MNFRPNTTEEALEINLVPLIDVLLVVLIFLAATTTFTKQYHMEVNLPQATASSNDIPGMTITISRDGAYMINNRSLQGSSSREISNVIAETAKSTPTNELIINADAQATHEAVTKIMEAASMANIQKVYFATQRGSN